MAYVNRDRDKEKHDSYYRHIHAMYDKCSIAEIVRQMEGKLTSDETLRIIQDIYARRQMRKEQDRDQRSY